MNYVLPLIRILLSDCSAAYLSTTGVTVSNFTLCYFTFRWMPYDGSIPHPKRRTKFLKTTFVFVYIKYFYGRDWQFINLCKVADESLNRIFPFDHLILQKSKIKPFASLHKKSRRYMQGSGKRVTFILNSATGAGMVDFIVQPHSSLGKDYPRMWRPKRSHRSINFSENV